MLSDVDVNIWPTRTPPLVNVWPMILAPALITCTISCYSSGCTLFTVICNIAIEKTCVIAKHNRIQSGIGSDQKIRTDIFNRGAKRKGRVVENIPEDRWLMLLEYKHSGGHVGTQ